MGQPRIAHGRLVLWCDPPRSPLAKAAMPPPIRVKRRGYVRPAHDASATGPARAGRSTVTGPRALPVAANPLNHAARAKS
jgi:hypothetical protein